MLMIVMFLRYMNTCQRDKFGILIEDAVPYLASRKLISIITVLKSIPLLVLGVSLIFLSTTPYFTKMKTIFAISIS